MNKLKVAALMALAASLSPGGISSWEKPHYQQKFYEGIGKGKRVKKRRKK